MTAEIGERHFGLVGGGRTNRKDYFNLNFDPNDSVLLGAGMRALPDATLSAFRIRDDRLGTGQRMTSARASRTWHPKDRTMSGLRVPLSLPTSHTRFSIVFSVRDAPSYTPGFRGFGGEHLDARVARDGAVWTLEWRPDGLIISTTSSPPDLPQGPGGVIVSGGRKCL